MECEREAGYFSGETSSSFEFSLSNSVNSNEEEFISVDSTVEPSSSLSVTALRTRWTRTAMSGYVLESEPEASDFSGETSSSFEFSLSNSADSNEEELVSVDSTVEPYQFEPVRASTSHASDSDGDDGDTGNGRLGNTNWYVYNGKDHRVQLFLCINRPCISLYIIIIQLYIYTCIIILSS